MTQIESKPTSSAVRTIRARVGPIAAAPPGHVNELIWRPTFMARGYVGSPFPAGTRSSRPGRSAPGTSAEEVHRLGDERRRGRCPRRGAVGAPRTSAAGPPGDLAEGQLRGRGDLVGDRPDRGAHDPPVGVGRPAQVLEGQQAGGPDRDVDDPPAPRTTERIGDRSTARSTPRRSRTARRIRAAEASGSTGSRVTTEPLSGPTLEASTPPLAQTNPWRVSVMMTPVGHPDHPDRLAQDDLDLARIAVPALGEGDRLGSWLDRASGRRSPPRPSRRPSG